MEQVITECVEVVVEEPLGRPELNILHKKLYEAAKKKLQELKMISTVVEKPTEERMNQLEHRRDIAILIFFLVIVGLFVLDRVLEKLRVLMEKREQLVELAKENNVKLDSKTYNLCCCKYIWMNRK